jgi:hypothetical protein
MDHVAIIEGAAPAMLEGGLTAVAFFAGGSEAELVAWAAGSGIQLVRMGRGWLMMRNGCVVGKIGCFAQGTPLLTPSGWKAIEDFVVGDEILSRDEEDPVGPVHAQVVEAVFQRHTRVMKVVVGGHEVVLTDEHPFFTFRQGWTAAHKLVAGDLVLGMNNDWVKVEAVETTEQYEIVYNITVRDAHTFFVGKPEWNFAVWVHNTKFCGGRVAAAPKNAFPANPNDFTKQLGVQPSKISTTKDGTVRMVWEPNANTRIRYESHPEGLKPGDPGFNPRHHGEHYHVETKPDGLSWGQAERQGKITKVKPEDYTPGSGTGFVPGEPFPGK